MRFLTPGVLVGILVLGLAAPAQALSLDPAPLPPAGLTGEVDNENRTVLLAWDPPPSGSVQAYNIYRNGELITQTQDTLYEEPLPTNSALDMDWAVYHVTAVSSNMGIESAPSTPFMVLESPICEPVIISFKPGSDPPIGAGVDDACIEGLMRSIEKLIGGPHTEFDIIDPFELLPE